MVIPAKLSPDGKITFSTGKTIDESVIGTSVIDDGLTLSAGYDSTILTYQETDDSDDDFITRREAHELCLLMAEIWLKKAKSVLP